MFVRIFLPKKAKQGLHEPRVSRLTWTIPSLGFILTLSLFSHQNKWWCRIKELTFKIFAIIIQSPYRLEFIWNPNRIWGVLIKPNTAVDSLLLQTHRLLLLRGFRVYGNDPRFDRDDNTSTPEIKSWIFNLKDISPTGSNIQTVIAETYLSTLQPHILQFIINFTVPPDACEEASEIGAETFLIDRLKAAQLAAGQICRYRTRARCRGNIWARIPPRCPAVPWCAVDTLPVSQQTCFPLKWTERGR